MPPMLRTAPSPVRVLLADDHALFRRALRLALERRPGIAVVGEAGDGRHALRLIGEVAPDVAVLDCRMPGLSGPEVCAALAGRTDPPATAPLLLSAHGGGELVWEAVRAGVAGYLSKSESTDAICDAVVRVARGGVAYSAGPAADIARRLARPAVPGHQP